MNDDTQLNTLLKGAARSYGEVSGYTEAPKADKPRWLKGHRAMHRDVATLHRARRMIADMLTYDEEGSRLKLPDQRGINKVWNRIRLHLLPDSQLEPRQVMVRRRRWEEIDVELRDTAQALRATIANEVKADQQKQMQRALNRLRGDFGRKRRTFRAALLRNPPRIPLWGAMSSHPDTVVFSTWTKQQV